jgi:hypothetical protein
MAPLYFGVAKVSIFLNSQRKFIPKWKFAIKMVESPTCLRCALLLLLLQPYIFFNG